MQEYFLADRLKERDLPRFSIYVKNILSRRNLIGWEINDKLALRSRNLNPKRKTFEATATGGFDIDFAIFKSRVNSMRKLHENKFPSEMRARQNRFFWLKDDGFVQNVGLYGSRSFGRKVFDIVS